MKRLVLQVDIPGIKTSGMHSYDKEIYAVSEFFAKKYAKKYDADYYKVVNQDDFLPVSHKTPTYLRFKAYDFRMDYNQILYLDSDYIIKDTAPDIFKIANGRTCVCRDPGEEIAQKLGVPKKRYFNAGMILFDKKDLNLTYQKMLEYLDLDWDYYDQDLINFLFYSKNINLKFLEPEFWNPVKDGFGKYADHYAGDKKTIWDIKKYEISNIDLGLV
jgi:hypothetical protein